MSDKKDVTRRYIKLIHGYKAIVDASDYDYLMQWHWTISGKRKGSIPYAIKCVRKDSKMISIRMHRFILNPPNGMEVDHINGNPLDNRRSNLRIVTRQQNSWNRAIQINNKSGYRGVSFQDGKWASRVRHKGKLYYLGCFTKKVDAAIAYNKKVIELRGESSRLFSRLNIIKIKNKVQGLMFSECNDSNAA